MGTTAGAFARRPRGSRVVAAATASVFNPATASLTAWWRDFASSPLSGTASAGSSGSNSLTEATDPPASGGALNGHAAMQFDGSNDKLTANGTLDTYFNANAGSGWALVTVDAVTTNAAGFSANDCIISSVTSGRFGLFLTNNAGTYSVNLGIFDGAAKVTAASGNIALATPTLVRFKWNGSNIFVNTDGFVWTSAAAGSIDNVTFGLQAGVSPSGAVFTDVNTYEIGLSDTVLDDTFMFTDLPAYINDRYSLAIA